MEARSAQTPDADEQSIESEIRRKGLTAPRLTPDAIDAKITSEAYYVFPGTTLTVCLLTLSNGFHVTGESAAASPANFDEEIGRKIARRNARDKIWSLEGYLLREQLSSPPPMPLHGNCYVRDENGVSIAAFIDRKDAAAFLAANQRTDWSISANRSPT